MSDIPKDRFKGSYYDSEYFAARAPNGGKSFRQADGSLQKWSYFNPDGEWLGCKEITEAWNEIFKPVNLLDVGCGRGQIVAYARDIGIEAEGFDFSKWAISDEGRYPRCKAEWLRLHGATETWPYEDNSFDLLVALDFFEHIYEDDLDFVIGEMYRVASKNIFLQIAVSGTGGLQGRDQRGYILKKGHEIPIGLEGCAVAGHVTVKPEDWWYERLYNDDWLYSKKTVNHFCSLVDPKIISNWTANSIIVMELFE